MGDEAVATEYVRSSRLFFTRRSSGGDGKGSGACFGRGALGDVGPVVAGDIATEPRTIDAIAALPAGHSDSGRVGEGAWEGTGSCPGGY